MVGEGYNLTDIMASPALGFVIEKVLIPSAIVLGCHLAYDFGLHRALLIYLFTARVVEILINGALNVIIALHSISCQPRSILDRVPHPKSIDHLRARYGRAYEAQEVVDVFFRRGCHLVRVVSFSSRSCSRWQRFMEYCSVSSGTFRDM
jgi:hypothetical protein